MVSARPHDIPAQLREPAVPAVCDLRQQRADEASVAVFSGTDKRSGRATSTRSGGVEVARAGPLALLELAPAVELSVSTVLQRLRNGHPARVR